MLDGPRYAIAIACLLVLVGGFGLLEPPGLYGFAATDCSPNGDCTSHLAPTVYSVITLIVGLGTLLGSLVQTAVATYRGDRSVQ